MMVDDVDPKQEKFFPLNEKSFSGSFFYPTGDFLQLKEVFIVTSESLQDFAAKVCHASSKMSSICP